MTVKELKEKLENLPDHMDVFIEHSDEEFCFELLTETNVIPIKFGDDPDEFAVVDCLVLSDDSL